jgi:streptogramin lyase
VTPNKSFLPWLVTVALLSCQPHVPTVHSSATQVPALSAPTQGAGGLSPLAARQFQERLDSATAHITSSARGDALALKVQVVRPPMRTQSVDLHRIKYLKGLVQAADLNNPLENENGFVTVNASNNELRITGVPKGKNRIVTVEAWEDCASTELGETYCRDGKKRIEEIVLKAIYSSQDNIHDVQVNFTLQSTVAANVIEQLMQLPLGVGETQQDRIDLINSIDSQALNTLIQQTTEQASVHPARLQPEAIAETILSNAAGGGSLLPTASPTPPAAWLKPEAVAVQVMAQSAAEGPYSNSTIILQINDPMSEALMIPPGAGNSVTFPSVLPGTWEIIASLQDNQTGVIHNQQRLKITVPEDGTPVLTTLEGAPVSSPAVLTLPPLLSGFQTSGGTSQNSFPAESTIVVKVDGVDAVHLNNNQVLVGGTPAEIVGLTPDGELQVKLPPNLVGESLAVTVKTGNYSSETQFITLLPAVTAVDKQAINSSAGPLLQRTLTLTVAGFNPLDYDDLTVNLTQTDGTPLVLTPLSKTDTTISLEVPQFGIQLGPQVVQVVRNSELDPLPSPLVNILDFSQNSTVNITSPQLQAGIDQYFIVKGVNFAPGNNSNGTPYTQVTLNGVPLAPTDYEVIDTETLRVKASASTGIQITGSIPINSQVPVNPAAIQVCIYIEGSNMGCDNDTVTIVSSPSLSQPYLPAVGQPLVLTGYNLTGTSSVTIGNVDIPPGAFVVSPNGQQITIANPPALTPGTPVTITAPGGIITKTLMTSAPVITAVGLLHDTTEPLVITGRNLQDVTAVTLGNTSIPLQNVTVSPDGTSLTIVNPPAVTGATSVSVTTQGGTATQTVTPFDPLYAEVLNFAGPLTGTLAGQAPAPHAQFSYVSYDPHGINVDTCTNDFYVVDNSGSRVFKHASDGRILWVLGSGAGHIDGSHTSGNVENFRTSVKFRDPEDIANTPDGTLYLADTSNHAIRVINPAGTMVSTLPVTEEIRGPEGVEVSANGRYLYVSMNTSPNASFYQPNNQTKVMRIDLAENTQVNGKHLVETVAGGFQRADQATGDEPLASATFHHLEGLGMDQQDNIYVAESDKRQIRKIDLHNQKVTVHADFSSFPYFSIHEIRVDWEGNVIVPGHDASTLYRVAPSGAISLVAGQTYGLTQGPVTSSLFRRPTGVDFDSAGNLFVADRNWGIRKITRFQPMNPPMIPANCP